MRPTRAVPRALPTWTASGRFGRRAPRLKPFLYGLAIEKEFLTAASILEDSPLQIPTAGGLYVPENYDREFLGPVSLRTALSASLNIPAVRTLMLVTPDSFVERLRALGMTSLAREADYYGYSLALGSADVTLYELVNAYRTLANRGRWGALRIAAGEAPKALVPVMDGRAAFIVSAILSDREARSATFGLENPLATRFWTAVKTGTSKDMRDNWCVGYSERYTVGVWVGNFSGEPMWNVSGMAGAAPVWLDVMNHLHRRSASKAPKAAPGVVSKQVTFRGNLEPPRTEWFIAGTEPQEAIARETRHEIARIVYPQPATIITLDPDIPAELQRVSFVGRFAGDTHEWRLDEKVDRLVGLAALEARARQARALARRRGEPRGRLGHLHREITPSFFIHNPQRAHRANTFFVDSLRNATERKIIRPPYCFSVRPAVTIPADKGQTTARRETESPGERSPVITGGGFEGRRFRGGALSFRTGLAFVYLLA